MKSASLIYSPFKLSFIFHNTIMRATIYYINVIETDVKWTLARQGGRVIKSLSENISSVTYHFLFINLFRIELA